MELPTGVRIIIDIDIDKDGQGPISAFGGESSDRNRP
jgi:hypothetical protein